MENEEDPIPQQDSQSSRDCTSSDTFPSNEINLLEEKESEFSAEDELNISDEGIGSDKGNRADLRSYWNSAERNFNANSNALESLYEERSHTELSEQDDDLGELREDTSTLNQQTRKVYPYISRGRQCARRNNLPMVSPERRSHPYFGHMPHHRYRRRPHSGKDASRKQSHLSRSPPSDKHPPETARKSSLKHTRKLKKVASTKRVEEIDNVEKRLNHCIAETGRMSLGSDKENELVAKSTRRKVSDSHSRYDGDDDYNGSHLEKMVRREAGQHEHSKNLCKDIQDRFQRVRRNSRNRLPFKEIFPTTPVSFQERQSKVQVRSNRDDEWENLEVAKPPSSRSRSFRSSSTSHPCSNSPITPAQRILVNKRKTSPSEKTLKNSSRKRRPHRSPSRSNTTRPPTASHCPSTPSTSHLSYDKENDAHGIGYRKYRKVGVRYPVRHGIQRSKCNGQVRRDKEIPQSTGLSNQYDKSNDKCQSGKRYRNAGLSDTKTAQTRSAECSDALERFKAAKHRRSRLGRFRSSGSSTSSYSGNGPPKISYETKESFSRWRSSAAHSRSSSSESPAVYTSSRNLSPSSRSLSSDSSTSKRKPNSSDAWET